MVWLFADSSRGLALRTLSNCMSPIEAKEASVIRLQFLNSVLCVCYLLAVLGPMTFRFAEGFRCSLKRHFWSAWPRAYLEGGGSGNVSRSCGRLAPYFLGAEGSVHLIVYVFQEFCDAALRNFFTLCLDEPTAANVGRESAQEFWR